MLPFPGLSPQAELVTLLSAFINTIWFFILEISALSVSAAFWRQEFCLASVSLSFQLINNSLLNEKIEFHKNSLNTQFVQTHYSKHSGMMFDSLFSDFLKEQTIQSTIDPRRWPYERLTAFCCIFSLPSPGGSSVLWACGPKSDVSEQRGLHLVGVARFIASKLQGTCGLCPRSGHDWICKSLCLGAAHSCTWHRLCCIHTW